MSRRTLTIILLTTVLAVAAIIALTAVLVPENTNPAFDVAVNFTNSAGDGEDELAAALLTDDLQSWVAENCPDGSVAACVDDYTPPEWGGLIAAVFRRAIPEGTDTWHVHLVATYEEEQGFAGVCIYNRVDQVEPGTWRVSAWSGFVSCDDPNSGLNALRRETAANRAP
jgi:hypothetical protein